MDNSLVGRGFYLLGGCEINCVNGHRISNLLILKGILWLTRHEKIKWIRHFFADIYITLFSSFTFVYLQLQLALYHLYDLILMNEEYYGQSCFSISCGLFFLFLFLHPPRFFLDLLHHCSPNRCTTCFGSGGVKIKGVSQRNRFPFTFSFD